MNKLEFVGIQKFSLYPDSRSKSTWEKPVHSIESGLGSKSNNPIPALLQPYV